MYSSGMKTAHKQAEKVDVLHEYVRYCVTNCQQFYLKAFIFSHPETAPLLKKLQIKPSHNTLKGLIVIT